MPDFELELTLRARLICLNDLTEAVNSFAGKVLLPECRTYQLQLALEELFVNFVSHGQSPDGCMTIRLACSRQRLHVETRDDGIPFDPLQAETPDIQAPLEVRPIGGLGIYLLREIGDQLDYRHADGQNIVTLEFATTPSLPTD